VADFSPGLRLSDRYLLDRRVGAGALWLAHDELLGRAVAVRPAGRHDARTAASVSHPYVTQVLDFGEARDLAGAALPYLVTEVLEGEDLAHRLAGGPPLPWTEAVGIAAHVASALAAAHAVGVVHGDVRPGTVVLTPGGTKLVDLGLPAMDPVVDRVREPDDDGALGPAGDVAALGALLDAVLAGAAGVPPEIHTLARRCQDPDPDQRPTSEQAARVLRAAVRRPLPPRARIARVASAAFARASVVATAPVPARTWARVDPPAPRWWRAPATAAASMLLVAGLMLVGLATFEGRGTAGPLAPRTVAAPPVGPYAAAPFAIVEPPAARTRPMAAAAEAPPTAVARTTADTRAEPAPGEPAPAHAAPDDAAPDPDAPPRAAPPPDIDHPVTGERWGHWAVIRCLADLRDYLTRPAGDRADLPCRG
jgi:serine/threonine-protein kinase